MSFKENLLQKIKIDKMSKKVIDSLIPSENGFKLDKPTMRELLEISSYKLKRKRDLDLYVNKAGDILVLDNELPIYRTTEEDVALRKSPTVKEMISIRNIIKILNDKDVIISKREESVKTIQKECVNTLDLSFNESDLEEIEKDGSASLEREYTEGVLESLALFAELLGYRSTPKVFKISNYKVMGPLTEKESGEAMFGPIIIYSLIYNKLIFIDEQIGSYNKAKIEKMHRIANGKDKASGEGNFVFQYLKKTARKSICSSL